MPGSHRCCCSACPRRAASAPPSRSRSGSCGRGTRSSRSTASIASCCGGVAPMPHGRGQCGRDVPRGGATGAPVGRDTCRRARARRRTAQRVAGRDGVGRQVEVHGGILPAPRLRASAPHRTVAAGGPKTECDACRSRRRPRRPRAVGTSRRASGPRRRRCAARRRARATATTRRSPTIYRRHADTLLRARPPGPERPHPRRGGRPGGVRAAVAPSPSGSTATRGSLRSFLLAQVHGRSVDLLRAEVARRGREERDACARTDRTTTTSSARCSTSPRPRRCGPRSRSLSEAERDAIELAYFGGHTYREVAVLLEQPEGTVKSRIRSGLLRLRASFDRRGDPRMSSQPSDDEMHELLGAYALDALDDDERARVDAYLGLAGARVPRSTNCARRRRCLRSPRGRRKTAPAELWARIEARIDRGTGGDRRAGARCTVDGRAPRVERRGSAGASPAAGRGRGRDRHRRPRLPGASTCATRSTTRSGRGPRRSRPRSTAAPTCRARKRSRSTSSGTSVGRIVVLPDGTGYLVSDELGRRSARTRPTSCGRSSATPRSRRAISAGVLGPIRTPPRSRCRRRSSGSRSPSSDAGGVPRSHQRSRSRSGKLT